MSSSAPTTNWASMPTSPNSLTITAIGASVWRVKILLSSVVFPAPRKPVRTVHRTFATTSSVAVTLRAQSRAARLVESFHANFMPVCLAGPLIADDRLRGDKVLDSLKEGAASHRQWG